MKTLVLYHGGCFDGFGGAWVAEKVFKDQGIYLPVQHGTYPPELEKGSPVFVIDFCYSLEYLKNLKESAGSLTIIDHHKTTLTMLTGSEFEENAILNVEKSGAMLAWEYWFPQENPPLLLQYIQDRDLWKFELEESKAISAAIHSYPMEFKIWNDLANRIDTLKIEGKHILRFQDQIVLVMCDKVQWVELGKYRIPAVNATACWSEVGAELLRRFPLAPFVATYWERKDGKRQWSLRSKGDFDVSTFAQQFGGGGHREAAGFIES